MTLGEKIRRARLEQGLSQRALAGERITRNMLSQIENGSASPSVETLLYLARRLNKPAGWFLEDRIGPLEEALALYTAGELRRCYGLLQERGGEMPTRERELLRQRVCLALGEQAAEKGRALYAETMAGEALEALRQSFWMEPEQEARILSLRAWACRADPDAFRPAAQALEESVKRLPRSRERLTLARLRLLEGNPDVALRLLEGLEEPEADALAGEAYYSVGAFDQAAARFRAWEQALPEREKTAAWEWLERCCREQGDYKEAYAYAVRQLSARNG